MATTASPAEPGRAGYTDHLLRVFAAVGSPHETVDELELRQLFELSYDRGVTPAGTERQLAAIFTSGNRTRQLRAIRAPTLVIHGTADRLVPASGGRATARAIPGAHLLSIAGMGHDLPRSRWPQLVDAIAGHAAQAAPST